MPAQRSSKTARAVPQGDQTDTSASVVSQYFAKSKSNPVTPCVRESNTSPASIALSTPVNQFPRTHLERDAYRTTLGKRLTPHQWDVYDFVLTIPEGKVATYKDVALAAGGSPRSVGGALRNNPFSPFVPCHRVIASNLFIGGFFGEWGKEHKTGKRCHQKIEMLSKEGILFDDKGQLLHKQHVLLNP